MKGYVYVMSNPSMPDLLKIGFSSKDPKERAAELSKDTSVPKPFVLEYEAHVENPKGYEQSVHKRLQQKRPNKSREFFECSIEEAVIAIKEATGLELIYDEYHKAKREQIEESLKRAREANVVAEKRQNREIEARDLLRAEEANIEAKNRQNLERFRNWRIKAWIGIPVSFIVGIAAVGLVEEIVGTPIWWLTTLVFFGAFLMAAYLFDKFFPDGDG